MKTKLLFLLTLSISFIGFSQVPTIERDALLALYNATDGANWRDNTNWDTNTPVADWYGVTVETINGKDHVTEIFLAVNNLTGSIPAEIGNLTNLTTLALWTNSLTGSIPAEIGRLTNLKELDLVVNNLTGSIPVEIGNLVNLEKLYLQENELTGSIPAEIGNLISLTILESFDNNLTGSIPLELGNLVNLSTLRLERNNLTGNLPLEIGNLTNLTLLWLWNNNLTGHLNLQNATKLSNLGITGTSISSINMQRGTGDSVVRATISNNAGISCISVTDTNDKKLTLNNPTDTPVTYTEDAAACQGVLSIADVMLKQNVTLYPNPVVTHLKITNTGATPIQEVIITNMLGQIVAQNTGLESIDVSGLKNGMYLVTIVDSKNASAVYKIVKK